jgi:hypothetical protein
VVSYLLLYLIYLPGHDLFAPFGPLQGRSQVAFLAEGRQPIREFLKDYIGSKKTAQRCPCFAPFEGLQVSPRNLQISSRFVHFRLPERRFSTACAVHSADLSKSGVLASAFVSI